jgi:hypothetical protein
VVSAHRVVAQPFAQLVGDALCEIARIDEHQSGVVLADQCRDAVYHIAKLIG